MVIFPIPFCIDAGTLLIPAVIQNKTGGEKFSSLAIESILENHPKVLEAGVVWVVYDDLGDRPKAYVTAMPRAHLEPQELIEWVKGKDGISEYMVPQEVEVMAERLPRISTGKVKRLS